MNRPFVAACVQMTSGRDMEANIQAASMFIAEACDRGADIVFLPENVALMDQSRGAVRASAAPEKHHPAVLAFQNLARERRIWLHCGSIAMPAPDSNDCASGQTKLVNRTILVNPDGEITARYDKIHLFDVDLPNNESYRESKSFANGNRAVAASTPFGRLGLAICYDLRFPGLFRVLAQGGASYIALPAAFTRQTGRAHWHTLIRARAIENFSYLIAPAQCGDHQDGRATFGHSLIVSPWGDVLADAGPDKPGVILAQVDPSLVSEARARIPSLSHDRTYTLDCP